MLNTMKITSRRLTRVLSELGLRLCAGAGLGASALLLWEYLRPDTGWCTEGSGCDTVRLSSYSHIYGIPVPYFGIAFFAGVLVPILWPRFRVLLPIGAAIGALFAIRLFYIMAYVLRAYCPYCVIVDVASLLLLALALWQTRAEKDNAVLPLSVSSFSVFFAALFPFGYGIATRTVEPAAPVLAEARSSNALPRPIELEQRPGVVTIVEFSDFECPHCRDQHLLFTSILPVYGNKVRVVRKHLPLVDRHDGAEIAARAACCAEEEGRGEEMANALFRAEPINADVCEALAHSLDLDIGAFGSCLVAERTKNRLLYDRRDAEACKVEGLPTFWIGKERFDGRVRDAETLRASIERALRQERRQGG
jgi:uncharacterized membrane protein/protein-disulfide isomerase